MLAIQTMRAFFCALIVGIFAAVSEAQQPPPTQSPPTQSAPTQSAPIYIEIRRAPILCWWTRRITIQPDGTREYFFRGPLGRVVYARGR